MNGRLRGALDFWLDTGPEFRFAEKWSLEAGLRHLCRHETSRDNPVILDVNEVLGIIRFRDKGVTLGLGLGGYIGKTKDFRNLAMFSLILPDFPAEGISLESEVKWVNFSGWYYETGFSVALGRGTALFIRGARTYQFPSALYIGFRYDSREPAGGPLGSFSLALGAIPFDDRYKLAAAGEYRLAFYEKDKSRFIADVGFSSPILAGKQFLAQFRPDRLIYKVRGEYEREVGRSLYASWYAAYALDMPVDKALPFAGALGTGLEVKNQSDFERLDRSFRFDVAAGWNFKYDQELSIRIGANTVNGTGINVGTDLDFRMSGRRRAEIEGRLFASAGRTVAFRPFIGLRNRPSLSGDGPTGKLKLVVGLVFFRWI